MAQYLVLIYGDEKAVGDGGPELWQQLHKGHMEFGQTHGKAIAGGNALESTATATSIRRNDDGSQTVTDGPFAETKEWIAGYDVIECDNLDDAIDFASRHPMAYNGRIEIRPFHVWED
jgi:hypothetical protein